MAFTSHNHQIPGTIMEVTRPGPVTDCGGPYVCKVCTDESVGVADREVEAIYGRPYSPSEHRK